MISAQNYILQNLRLKNYLLEIRASNSVADFIVWEYTTYSNYVLTFKGFPQLQIAMISNDMGVIKAFPIDGQPYETFPKLQHKKFDGGHFLDTYLPL